MAKSKYKFWRFWQMINTDSDKRRTKLPLVIATVAAIVFTLVYWL